MIEIEIRQIDQSSWFNYGVSLSKDFDFRFNLFFISGTVINFAFRKNLKKKV